VCGHEQANTFVKRLVVFIALTGLAMAVAPGAGASTPEERVDHRTQAALAMDAHPLRGAAYYTRYCARCHGTEAQGDAGSLIPALAGQRFAYLVRQLADFAGAERDSTTMHKVATQAQVNEPQSWVDLASFLNNLPPPANNQVGTGEAIALGRGVFHEQCAACHGREASGDKAGFVPSLRHQHYDYLNKQMHKLAQGSRHNSDEELVLFMRSFDERDMSGTADYLSRLKGAGPVHKSMRDNGVVVN
jgi:cytochrome c553